MKHNDAESFESKEGGPPTQSTTDAGSLLPEIKILSTTSSEQKSKKLPICEQLCIAAFALGSQCLWGSFLGVILPREVQLMAGELNKGPAVGAVHGAGAFIGLFVPLFIGGWTDRCRSPLGRRRPFMLVGGIITIVGVYIMWFAAELSLLWAYVIGFATSAVGNNVATTAFNSLIPDFVPPSQRGIVSGWMGGFSQLGTVLGVVVSGLFLEVNRLSAYSLIAGIITISLMVTVIGFNEPPCLHPPPPQPFLAYVKSLYIDPKKHPDFAWVWVTRFLVMFGFHGVQPYFQYYLKEQIRVADPVKTTAILGAIICLGATVSAVIGGLISDKVGRKKVVYVANTFLAATSFGFIFCRSLLPVFILGILFGIGYGAYLSVDWALGTSVLTTETDTAKDMAVWHIAITLPQTFAGPLCGLLLLAWGVEQIDGVEGYKNEGYATVLLLCGISIALGAVLIRNVKGLR
mmetsp:Transcript_32947/g.55566  ORF Transcript_32947/g.55566 Transcript_32947/m.55566 type:complete len:461 (+) Transcript_32947:158-1540(+)